MSEKTKIEWCDGTVNWWAGCSKISPACDICYAERMAGRLWGTQWGAGQPRTQFAGADATLKALDRKAKRLGTPLTVFHNSLSDFFDKEVPVQWRISALRSMLETRNLIHLVLTKRIGNAGEMLEAAFRAVHAGREGWSDNVPPHIWIGATICNQEEADRDIPKLLALPAAKRFLSMEPLLGPVNLQSLTPMCAPWFPRDVRLNALTGETLGRFSMTQPSPTRINWVIVGGESGPGARPMHPDWTRSLRDQCQAAGVPFLFKQWGEWKPISQMEEAQHTSLYVPNRKAKSHEDQGNLDDIFGRRCTVETAVVHLNGTTHAIAAPMAFLQGTGAMQTFKVGKEAAGRLLGGRTWDGVPT